MYILPGYTDFYEENGVIFVSSKVLPNTVKLTDFNIQKEFRSIVRCGGCSELSTPLTQLLHEQKLLANESEIKDTLKEAQSLLEEVLFLVIMPTEGCNFRCPYCYEDHAPISMSRQILDQIQAYIAEQAPRFKYVQANWFGGEPTLCKDTILETCSLIQSLQATHHFQYSSNMTTNGYLLNAEYFQQFYAAGITAYQITLDGWDHDKTRPHISGKKTLQTILDNLLSLSDLSPEKYNFHIVLRHNILAGDEDFSWYDHLYNLFGTDRRFSVLIRPVGNWGGESVHSLNILTGDKRDSLVLEHIAYLKEINMQCENGVKSPFSKVCYASFPHSMVFRANGKIEKCTVALDHPKNLLGFVDSDKGVVLNPEINNLWGFSGLKPECTTCSDILSCFNMQCKKSLVIDGQTSYRCSRILSDIY